MLTELYTQKIGEEHKAPIEAIRAKYGHDLSSHAFSSLYLWQKVMGLSVLMGEDFFAVKCAMNGENSWFFPCGSEQEAYGFISRGMDDENFSLCYLRECDVKWLESRFPGRWKFRRAEASDEYICDISEYVSLDGSKFSEIRRKIRKLDKSFDMFSQPISGENINDAVSVVSEWNGAEHSVGENGITDEAIAELALEKRELLGVDGIILYADGRPVSVFAGFALSLETVDVLIGKCVPDAPKGAAYYALREYLRLCLGKYTYCNHEEDLGIEGIRQMKNSLCPIAKTSVWEAVLIK